MGWTVIRLPAATAEGAGNMWPNPYRLPSDVKAIGAAWGDSWGNAQGYQSLYRYVHGKEASNR